MKNLHVYRGQSAVNDFLNPENHLTPLVELSEKLNPFIADQVHIYIKLQTFLPLMNIKSIPAYEMLKQDMSPTKKIIESSSGNMAFSLSILSRSAGYEKMKAVISHEISLGKLQLLLFSGAEVLVNQEPICPNPDSPNSGIQIAKKTGQKTDWKNLNQYANLANPEGHYYKCGQQILKQMDNNVQIFCTSLGTTGSMCGISQALKKKTSAFCLGVVRKPNNPVPGPRTLNLLKMINFNWQNHIDALIDEGTRHAYEQSLKLCRAGILAGPSSGLNLAGLLRFLRQEKLKHGLEKFRNSKGEINCVILACDLPFLYMDEYFKYLPRSFFPKIFHEKKLLNHINFRQTGKQQIIVSAATVMKKFFMCTPGRLWRTMTEGKSLSVNESYILIDLRSEKSFSCGHIPESINISESQLIAQVDALSEQWRGRKLILICEYGELSYFYARILQDKGYYGFSLSGGFIKWSELNYPRSSLTCPIRR